MAASPTGEDVVHVNDVEYSPLGEQSMIVRIRGRWLADGAARPHTRRTMLVVRDRGRTHRFKAIPPRRRDLAYDPEAWTATFAIPVWIATRLDGRMTLSIGDTELPVPASSENGAEPEAQIPDTHTPEMPVLEAVTAETVRALRDQLAQRSGTLARVQGMLVDVQAELEARAATQARLETMQGELSDELATLRSALESARHERAGLAETLEHLRGEFAAVEIARDAAAGEATALRGEVDRLGSELARTRQNAGDHASGLAQAEALLAEARALTASLRDGD
jgi:hypothetical protein